MEMQLQFGYGMMDHSKVLIERWGGGAVILSPRDLSPTQLTKFAQSLNRIEGSRVLLDPQFYLPNSDHARLTSHSFWPEDQYATGAFWQGAGPKSLLTQLHTTNVELGCAAMILPGLLASRIDDDWLARQAIMDDEAQNIQATLPIVTTVALTAEAIGHVDDIEALISAAETWSASSIYLVCEHPGGSYLVDDPTWLANLLDLVAGLTLCGKKVTVGYANHQLLALACAGAQNLASGTWMNVRSFPPDKFKELLDEEMRQRKTWYYAPSVLSEFGIPYLDIAKRQGVMNLLAVPPEMSDEFAAPLFGTVQPTSISWSEQFAFRHYLCSLHSQVAAAHRSTFAATVQNHLALLDVAENALRQLHKMGVRGQNRDFGESIDANRAAIELLRSNRGAILERNWNSINAANASIV